MIDHSPSEQIIISCLSADYGINVAAFKFLPIGADLNSAVYKAQASDHTSYFVKLRHGHQYDSSIAIVELLSQLGIKHVIQPIKTCEGKATKLLGDFTLIVSPFVEGQDGFNRDLTDKQWIGLGKVLKQVHEIDVPPSIQSQIRRESFSSQWRESARSLLIYIETGKSVDEVSLKLIKFMQQQAPEIHRLIKRAEELGQILRKQSPNFILCHSDIHGGNVLLEGNDNIYIVDWDDPIMAPKERDLMFIGGGVANVWNKPHEEQLFYKGYGKTDINLPLLSYYRHERIVEDIAQYGQELLLNPTDKKERQEMYNQFVAMFAPRGVVDIAFESDKGIN
jgi:spectinomycin phosphotransferase